MYSVELIKKYRNPAVLQQIDGSKLDSMNKIVGQVEYEFDCGHL